MLRTILKCFAFAHRIVNRRKKRKMKWNQITVGVGVCWASERNTFNHLTAHTLVKRSKWDWGDGWMHLDMHYTYRAHRVRHNAPQSWPHNKQIRESRTRSDMFRNWRHFRILLAVSMVHHISCAYTTCVCNKYRYNKRKRTHVFVVEVCSLHEYGRVSLAKWAHIHVESFGWAHWMQLCRCWSVLVSVSVDILVMLLHRMRSIGCAEMRATARMMERIKIGENCEHLRSIDKRRPCFRLVLAFRFHANIKGKRDEMKYKHTNEKLADGSGWDTIHKWMRMIIACTHAGRMCESFILFLFSSTLLFISFAVSLSLNRHDWLCSIIVCIHKQYAYMLELVRPRTAFTRWLSVGFGALNSIVRLTTNVFFFTCVCVSVLVRASGLCMQSQVRMWNGAPFTL